MEGTSREAVKYAHKQGLTVSLWRAYGGGLYAWRYLGADYLCTDIPIGQKAWAEKTPPG